MAAFKTPAYCDAVDSSLNLNYNYNNMGLLGKFARGLAGLSEKLEDSIEKFSDKLQDGIEHISDKIEDGVTDFVDNLYGDDDSANAFILNRRTKVIELKKQFHERFGSVLHVYEGRSQVDDAATLAEVGLTNQGTFECRGNLQVGTFITRMAEEHGLKVKVYTCDDWVAVLDGLTLTASGLVKKSATRADMETMLAGPSEGAAASGKTPVSEVKAGSFSIIKNSDGSYSVSIDGNICSNSKGAMRQIAEALGFEYDKAWTTQQFGAKLSRFIQENTGVAESAPAQKEEPAQEPNPAVDELKAEAERLKAEAEAAKAEVEAAKAAAEAAKAEAADKARAEAEAAKAEIERLKAEAEAAKAEAEKAKRKAEKAKAAPASVSVKANKKDGELPGVFTLKDGRKICFSKGNLQFHCKNYEFKFAEEQYETLGKEANEKCAPDYDGWIDIFGWGTSGYMGCQPTLLSFKENAYGPAAGDLTGENANFDWGAYNPISNGGNQEGLWRTPTKEEMEYLLERRPNADKLVIWCNVCDNPGWILLPDDFWNNRLRFAIDVTASYSCLENKFDAIQWSELESMGAVFFPKSDYRCASNEKYWENYDDGRCYRLWTTVRNWNFGKSGVDEEDCSWMRPCRFPVRLIKDLK